MKTQREAGEQSTDKSDRSATHGNPDEKTHQASAEAKRKENEQMHKATKQKG